MEKIKNKINSFYLIESPNYALVSISLCKFLYGFYTSAIGSLLVPIGANFDISIKLQSVIFPFNYLGQIVIIFFAGYFADKLGKKIVHIVLLLLLGIFALFFNYINVFYLFLIFFFFMGILGISINTIADAAVSDTFKEKKGFYLNIAHVFFGLGALTSPVLFNVVFSFTDDFRSIYFVLFIISFFVILLISAAKYPFVDNEKIRPVVTLQILKNKKFLLLCVFAMLSAGTMHSISGWIPTLFNKYLLVSAQISNYALSFFWIAIVVGRIITAFLSKRFNEFLLIKVLNALMFIVLAASFFFSSYYYLLANYLLFGLLIGGSFPLLIAYSAQIYPKYSATRLAIIFSFTAIGMFIVPTIVGVLADYFVIYKVIAVSSLSFLVYIYVFSRKMS
jgi:MFS transporter, FHS family, glucose/mannose:H+ symporter